VAAASVATARPAPTLPGRLPARADRVFQADILDSPTARKLGYRAASTPCLLKISATTITLIDDESRGEIMVWPMAQITGRGAEVDAFYFDASPHCEHAGRFSFRSLVRER